MKKHSWSIVQIYSDGIDKWICKVCGLVVKIEAFGSRPTGPCRGTH